MYIPKYYRVTDEQTINRFIRIEAKFKLSQNRRQPDYDNVIAELQKSKEPGAQAIAEAMAQNRISQR